MTKVVEPRQLKEKFLMHTLLKNALFADCTKISGGEVISFFIEPFFQ